MLSNFSDKSEDNSASVNQYVVFVIDEQNFGVDITQAKEIINQTELTSIPNAPDFVEGVTNLRGEIVPIINLDKRLGINNFDRKKESKIIIVEFENTLVGMEVEDVEGIIRLNTENIGKAPKITQGVNQEYISGVGKLDDDNKLLILLDLNKILTRDEIKQLENIETENN
ncbi:MAG TPA: chemotaxis protein CheW [Halanaerobiales bacterium]|nr:chemotaxis protein CheW [Halanaerobiales bacterium]